ncbi:MAG: hypothetical protein GTO63_24335 [Anaerolineae bacterium]|nr:hypothetical protein [Anaerolineae bacterium]NIN97852.1 hypothetical protein [Anaerolineae bacterium]
MKNFNVTILNRQGESSMLRGIPEADLAAAEQLLRQRADAEFRYDGPRYFVKKQVK